MSGRTAAIGTEDYQYYCDPSDSASFYSNGMLNLNSSGKPSKNVRASSIKASSEQTSDTESFVFINFSDAKEWAKQNIGSVIKRNPNGDGYIGVKK